MQPIPHWLRALAVLIGCSAAVAVGWWLTAPPVAAVLDPVLEHGPGAVPTLRFDTLVAGLAALLLGACGGWLVLSTATVTLLELAGRLAPGTRAVRLLELVVDRWSPVVVRRAVAAMVGTAVTAGLAAGPALAASPGHGDGLSGLAIPDRTTGAAGPSRAATPPAAGRLVVVHRGDCLWSIAADRLPPGASDADVAGAVHRLASANRHRIGPDPDLIVPGTRLVVPDLT